LGQVAPQALLSIKAILITIAYHLHVTYNPRRLGKGRNYWQIDLMQYPASPRVIHMTFVGLLSKLFVDYLKCSKNQYYRPANESVGRFDVEDIS
jgi:hypothetical protein